MESKKDKQLRLWKARQEAEGHDVSGVTTLEEAKHFFDKKESAVLPEVPEVPEVSEIPEIPEVQEEQEAQEVPKDQRARKSRKAKEV